MSKFLFYRHVPSIFMLLLIPPWWSPQESAPVSWYPVSLTTQTDLLRASTSLIINMLLLSSKSLNISIFFCSIFCLLSFTPYEKTKILTQLQEGVILFPLNNSRLACTLPILFDSIQKWSSLIYILPQGQCLLSKVLFSPKGVMIWCKNQWNIACHTHSDWEIYSFLSFFISLKNMTNLRDACILTWGLMSKPLNLYLNFLA